MPRTRIRDLDFPDIMLQSVLNVENVKGIPLRVAGMSLVASVLEYTWVYRAWQAPFAVQKFAPVLAHNPLHRVRRVLDVACGPGTNTKYFANADYLGIDFNERYIQNARRRHGRNFLVADVRN